MIRPAVIFLLSAAVAACAGNPASEPVPGDSAYTGQPQEEMLIPVAETGETPVCDPEVSDQRVALDDSCINRIDALPYDGKRYNAIGREIKEQKSLCDYMFLPRCRRKY